MTETVIHVVGHVGSDVERREVGAGTSLSTFRLATTPRHYDRTKGAYVDGTTSWLSVQCWRSLAVNVHRSVNRGDPVIVVGKLKTQEWVKDGERCSRFILEATAVGHDLTRGITSFTKMSRVPESFPHPSQAARRAAQDVEEGPTSLPDGAQTSIESHRYADAS
jgi:single-strand DNA-binding protein